MDLVTKPDLGRQGALVEESPKFFGYSSRSPLPPLRLNAPPTASQAFVPGVASEIQIML